MGHDTYRVQGQRAQNIGPATPITRGFAAYPVIRELPAHDAHGSRTPILVRPEDPRLRYARAKERVQVAAAARVDARAQRAQRAREQRAQASVRFFRA